MLALLLSAGLIGSPASAAGAGTFRLPLNSFNAWVAVDLDGDKKMDLATAGASRHEGAGYVQDLTVRLGSVETSTIVVRTAGRALRLRACDVDGDSDRDLVLEAFDQEPLAILLNDGEGHFHQGNLEDFRRRLRRHDSQSIEAPATRFDSPEMGEDAPNPSAEPGGSGFGPDLANAWLPAGSDGLWPVLERSSWPSRGPPLSF